LKYGCVLQAKQVRGLLRIRSDSWLVCSLLFLLSLAASALNRSTHGRKDNMKRLGQFTTPRTTDAPPDLSRRRLMGQVVLGGAAALMLTACGGGGGDSSTRSRDLVAAYDRLEDGMTWEEAIAAVGWQPNYGDTSWTDSGYLLSCSHAGKVGSDVQYLASAHISHAKGLNRTRNFSYK
jgi:hypothetical protein